MTRSSYTGHIVRLSSILLDQLTYKVGSVLPPIFMPIQRYLRLWSDQRVKQFIISTSGSRQTYEVHLLAMEHLKSTNLIQTTATITATTTAYCYYYYNYYYFYCYYYCYCYCSLPPRPYLNVFHCG